MYGLDIVPANKGLVILDRVLYGRPGYQYRLKNGLDDMDEGFYDYVLIDCPPSLGYSDPQCPDGGHLLVIPIQTEYYAAHTLLHFVRLVQRVREKTNPRLEYRVLVTMYDRRNKIYRVILEQMRRGLSKVLFNTIIEVDTKLRESPVFGQPITLYAPKTRGAQQYRALAKELINHG